MTRTVTREPALHRLPRVLSSLGPPGQAVGYLGPDWFASIMGTGIVANVAATLPIQVPGLHGFALTVWLVDALLLTVGAEALLVGKSLIGVRAAVARHPERIHAALSRGVAGEHSIYSDRYFDYPDRR
jgi:hypothetical protein